MGCLINSTSGIYTSHNTGLEEPFPLRSRAELDDPMPRTFTPPLAPAQLKRHTPNSTQSALSVQTHFLGPYVRSDFSWPTKHAVSSHCPVTITVATVADALILKY